jgi:hypothetical protein
MLEKKPIGRSPNLPALDELLGARSDIVWCAGPERAVRPPGSCVSMKGGGHMRKRAPILSMGCERLGVLDLSPIPAAAGGTGALARSDLPVGADRLEHGWASGPVKPSYEKET